MNINGSTISAGFYGGFLKQDGEDTNTIAQKKERAQKRATKTILDCHKQEKKMDDTMDALRQEQKQLTKDAGDYLDIVSEAKKQKEALKEEYGISGETKEDMAYLRSRGLEQEYKGRALEYSKQIKNYSTLAEQAKGQIADDSATLRDRSNARDKSTAMLDATAEADSILAAASKEAIGDYLNEMKDNIDDKLKENEEKLEEAKEEKKKEEEKKADKEKKQEMAASGADDSSIVMDTVVSHDIHNDEMITELKQYVVNAKVLPQDSSGIVIDEQI